MRHLLPFATLERHIKRLDRDGTSFVEMTEVDFENMVRMFLEAAPFDEDWYRARNPDVGKHLATGQTTTARLHYIWHGYFEGRAPYEGYQPQGTLSDFYTIPDTFYGAMRDVADMRQERRYTAALSKLRQALDLHPGSSTARRQLGELLLQCWHFREAEAYLAPVLAADPMDLGARVALAETALQFRQHQRRYTLLRTAPDDAADRFRLDAARLAWELGRLAEARDLAAPYVSAPFPDDRAFAATASRAYHAAHNEAMAAVRNRVRDGITTEALGEIALRLARVGRTRAARELITRALNQTNADSPASDLAIYYLLDACSIVGGNAAEALIRYLQEGIADRSIDLRLRLAWWLYEADRLNESIQALVLPPDISRSAPRAAELVVLAYLRRGDLPPAIELSRYAMRRWPEIFWPVEKLLHALFAAGRVTWGEPTTPGPGASGTGGDIYHLPQSLIQFWDKVEIPSDVSAATETWKQKNPDLNHRVFSDDSARAFLAQNYGMRHVVAFDLCHHPAMRSDLFRLAYLALHGGVYVDADETCLASVTQFLGAYPEANLYLIGAGGGGAYLYNGFIACAPQHPAIRNALEFAVSTILHRCKDGTRVHIWDTTGPGCVTRAVVDYIMPGIDGTTISDEALGGICLIPLQDYKALSRWDWMQYKTAADGNWRV